MSIGSIWARWDLHVHTPCSIEQGYSGDTTENWERFINDLENLHESIKVIGINDYITFEGYKKVLSYKRSGRLKNIECFLPVVELRLSHFGGTEDNWSRINLHVIFSNDFDIELIERKFLYRLEKDYHTGAKKIKVDVKKSSLEDYGQALKEDSPPEKRSVKSNHKLGFDNFNLEFSAIEELLKDSQFENKYLIALGKTEWNSLRWKEQHIGDKKNIINKSDILFIATNDLSQVDRDKETLRSNNINCNKILDCSDAHHFSDSSESNKLGNTFTWLNADFSFNGLFHAINDYENKVYIGVQPHKLKLVERNPTNYISQIEVRKLANSKLDEKWFNFNLAINNELVAIIGNKGKGKSALADIIAFLGKSSIPQHFSFLTNSRFREPKIKKAKNFEGTLTFCDGSTSKANLGDEIEEGSSERVKYLPQNYIDELCNKIENDGEMFQLEIEKVIFSHIPVEKRLETQNLTGFIEQKTEITNLEIKKIKEKIKIGTRGLANLYKKDTQTYKKKISNELNDKFEEYLNHLKFKPAITDSPVVQNNEKYSSNCLKKLIETYRLDLKNISNAIESKKTRLAFLTKEIIKVETFNEKVKFIKESINSLIDDNKDFLERNELDKNLISLNYDSEKMNQIQKLLQMEQEDIENKLNSENEESLISKRDNIQKKISRGNNLSTFQERAHQASLNEMQEWQSTLRSIVGDEGDSESLSGLNLLMNDLVGLDDKILESKNYLIDLSKDIFRLKLSLLESFKESYQGVQSFIDNYEDIQSDLNLNFYADINIFDLDDRFFSFITYSKKGSFYGEKEGNEQLKNLVSSISLESAESIEKFLKDLIIMLENNINKNNEKTEISSLLRKNKNVEDFLEMVFSLDYTKAQYSLRKDDNKISLLSPGDKGLVLLVFYLLIDTSTKPIIIDQPEENLDNQTIKKSLVPCIQEAKKHRQVILVTHNPNLAVVCGANQIIYSDINKTSGVNEVTYQSGNLQDPQINEKVVDILEGTLPAFMQREKTYYK